MDKETKQEFKEMRSQLGKMNGQFGEIKKEFGKISSQISKLTSFIREHVALKIDLQEMREEFDNKFANRQDVDRILTAVDGFAKQSKDNRDEIKILAGKIHRI